MVDSDSANSTAAVLVSSDSKSSASKPAPAAAASGSGSGAAVASTDKKSSAAGAAASAKQNDSKSKSGGSGSGGGGETKSGAKSTYGDALCGMAAHTFRYKMLHLIRDQIQCNRLLLPTYHNSKLHSFKLYSLVAGYCGLTPSEADDQMRGWDPAIDEIRTHFVPFMDS